MATPSEIYESYFVPWMFDPWARQLIGRADVRAEHRVLDLACGTGIVARRLAASVADVTGIDPNGAMLAVARQRAADEGVAVRWIEAAAEATGQPDASFDRVTCQQGVQYFADRAAAAREIARLLRPSGRVTVACWCPIEDQGLYGALDRVETRRFGPTVSVPFSFGVAGPLAAMFEDVGLVDVAVSRVTRQVRFPTPARFLELYLTGKAAVVPAFMVLSEADRAAKLAAITDECAPIVERFVEGDEVVFDMHAVIATAHAPGP